MAAITTAVIGLGVTATTVGMSMSQAAKQKKAEKKANNAAAKAMEEAKKKLDVNYAEALSINKEPYERAREALLVAGAQALEAGVESERGGAATAGRVLASQQEGQGLVRDSMNLDIRNLEELKVEEASRLRDIKAQLDLDEAEGQQMIAADARRNATAATNNAVQGLGDMATQIGTAVPLYTQDRKAQKGAAIQSGLYDPNGKDAGVKFASWKKNNQNFKFDANYLNAYNQITGVNSTPVAKTYSVAELQELRKTNPTLWSQITGGQ